MTAGGATAAASTPPRGADLALAFLRESRVDAPAAIDRWMTDDVEYTVISGLNAELLDVLPWVGRHRGRQDVKDYLARYARNQQLLEMSFPVVVSEAEHVALFGTLRTRAISTGKVGEWEFALRIRVRDGRIAEYFLYEDSYGAGTIHRRGGSWLVENGEAPGRVRTVPAGEPRR